MTIEQFCDLRTHFYTSSFQDFESQLDILDARTRAFDQEFWPQLQKAFTKLRVYQYGCDEGLEGDRMIIDNEEEENRCIDLQNQVRDEILGDTENIIKTLYSTVSEETFN